MNTSSSFFQAVPKGLSGFSGGAPQFDFNKSFTTGLNAFGDFGNASRAGGFLDKAKSGGVEQRKKDYTKQPGQGSWQDAAKTFGGMLSNIGEGRKAGDAFKVEMGLPMYGNAQSLGDGLSIYNAPTMAPIVIGGASAPQKGTGQRIAGAAGGALQGAAAGSAVMPGIGTAAGAVIGGIGGLFG